MAGRIGANPQLMIQSDSVIRPRNVLPNRMQPYAEEKEILNVELPAPPEYEHCRLVVFRELDHSPGTVVRLARQWKFNGQLLPPHSTHIDSFSHIFRPLYAFDTSRDQNLDIELCNADGRNPEVYQFSNLEDVFKLQWALSNYNVFSDMNNIDWTITRNFKSNICGKGSRIQLWWFDPEDELGQVASKTTSPTSRDSGRASILSTMTAAASRSLLQSSESKRMPRYPAHTEEKPGSEIVEAIPPYEPLLVVFTLRNTFAEYLSVQLHGQMYIDPSKCRCKGHEDRCVRSVLRSGNKVDFQVKRTSMHRAREKDLPNLNIFARPYRKGGPPHPQMHNVEDVVTRELVLDFADATERRRFNQRFQFIVKLQRSLEGTQAMLTKRAVFLSDRPRVGGNTRNRITGSVNINEESQGSASPPSSQSTVRTRSDADVRPVSLDTVFVQPDSARSSNLMNIYELSQPHYEHTCELSPTNYR